jgi:hypothetical protein
MGYCRVTVKIKDTNNIPRLINDMDGILDRVAEKVGIWIADKITAKMRHGIHHGLRTQLPQSPEKIHKTVDRYG